MERIKPSINLKQLTVLYVEDEKVIRDSFSLLIERYVKELFTAENGSEGLKIFQNNLIDIVISDIKMPKITGIDMAKQIKEVNYEIPVIFTTAFDDIDYLKQSLDLGIDGYITKPVDRNKLFQKLNFIADAIIAKRDSEAYMGLIEILFNYQKTALILFDTDLNIILYNKTFKNMCKCAKENKLFDINDFCCFNKYADKNEFVKELLHSNITQTCQLSEIERFFDIKLERIKNYYIMSFTDITEYKLENETIKESAMRDNLTGLFNRKKLLAIEKDILNINLSMIIFDIDNFKNINDTYGHLKGDEVLKKLSETVRKLLRDTDLVIRWGGEEFLVLLLNLKSLDIAKNIAEKLRIEINKIHIEDVGHFTCSFGVSNGTIHSISDFEKILEKADEALYEAKKTGKNKVVSK